MALFNTLRNWGNRMLNTLTTPVIGTGGIIDNTPVELRPLLSVSDEERAAQERVIVARAFHDGQHGVKLTERLRLFLGTEADQFGLRFNLTKKVNKAIAERLVIDGFDSTAKEAAAESQIAFANAVWAGSRMKGKRARVLTEAVRDGEGFWLIDFDIENNRPRITPHTRYTDATVNCSYGTGGGEGMWMVYPNDDTDQKPICAVKRWVERVVQVNGDVKVEPRLNVYYSERIVKYAQRGFSWVEIEELPWTDGGNPLGIPVVHVKSPELLPATTEAIPLQKGLNKLLIDLFASSDASAFRILVALGWNPTDKQGNPLQINPGQWVGTTDGENTSVVVVEGADLGNQIAVLDKMVANMADVVDVPLSLLNRSNQRAAEGTLQEEKESFGAKIRDYQETIEMAVEDALKIARRLANVYGDSKLSESTYGYGLLDEQPEFQVKWAPFTARSTAERAQEATALIASGLPETEVWQRVWDYSAKQSGDMQKAKDFGEGDPDSP